MPSYTTRVSLVEVTVRLREQRKAKWRLRGTGGLSGVVGATGWSPLWGEAQREVIIFPWVLWGYDRVIRPFIAVGRC